MSGGAGGIIIIGDDPLATQVANHIHKVAKFRQERATTIIGVYNTNENGITHDDQQFLLRCAADIVDNS